MQAFEEQIAGEDLARMAGKDQEQVELGAREGDRLAAACDLTPWHVDRQIVHPDCIRIDDVAVDPAQQDAHPGHQLARGKGLGDVVIGAQFQADQAVFKFDPRRQHDDGHIRGTTQRAADVQSVDAGQVQVEDDEVGTLRACYFQRRPAIAGDQHPESALDEIVARLPGDFGFVFDHEDNICYHRFAFCAKGLC